MLLEAVWLMTGRHVLPLNCSSRKVGNVASSPLGLKHNVPRVLADEQGGAI